MEISLVTTSSRHEPESDVQMTGVGVVSLNLETIGLDEVNESIAKSSGFVIGSPTLGGHMPTQVSTSALDHVFMIHVRI